MDMEKKKWKENMILKTWKKIKSFGQMIKNQNQSSSTIVFTKSKSWHCTTVPRDEYNISSNKKSKSQVVAPKGCLTVYVGAERHRFILRTQTVNHPFFLKLLEDAETEYGYRSEGPIVLPCHVDLFFKVLAEIENSDDGDETANLSVCGLCSPYRHGFVRDGSTVLKPYGSYKLLRMSPILKLNTF